MLFTAATMAGLLNQQARYGDFRLPLLSRRSHANDRHRNRVVCWSPDGVCRHDGCQTRLREREQDGCNISKSFGTLKAVTAESWLLFEDETGTLRAVDYGCRVERVINRQ